MSRTAVAIAGLCLYLAGLAGVTVFLARALGAGADGVYFNIQRWETEQILGHGLFQVRVLLELESAEPEDADALIGEYLALTAEVNRLSTESAVVSGEDLVVRRQLEGTEDRRREIENEVELIFARRVADAVRDLGLTTEAPLFSAFEPLWPPVEFEFDSPPQVLAISPRDKIELSQSDLLDPQLSLDGAINLESEYEGQGMSALVEEVGGVGTYPSTIRPRTSYQGTLEVVAHEWLHQYLFFYPLGFNYFSSQELRTLNETVANLVGEEIGRRAMELHPIPAPTVEPQPEREIDFRATMRSLRLEVDRLLAAGSIEAAEDRMEEVRLILAAGGFPLRKINQAYFAFNGSYGDTPQSSSPIGPKLITLREQSGSLSEFVRRVRDLTGEDDLDDLLADQ